MSNKQVIIEVIKGCIFFSAAILAVVLMCYLIVKIG